MRVVDQVMRNLQDARAMGVRYLFRHVSQVVPIKGVGPVTVRKGTTDARVFRSVFTTRQYDISHRGLQHAAMHERYAKLVADGRTPLILDLGANNGASALWFLCQFPAAEVVAVEPEPASAAACRYNTRGRRVDTVEAAIGSKPGHVSLVTEDRESWGIGTTRDDSGSSNIITVPELVAAHPDCVPFIAKVNIEGFESDLFAENTEWVGSFDVVFIEAHDWLIPGSSRTMQALFGRLDYDVVVSEEFLVYVRRS